MFKVMANEGTSELIILPGNILGNFYKKSVVNCHICWKVYNLNYKFMYNEEGVYGSVQRPGVIFNQIGSGSLTIDIENSFKLPYYFVIPNIKGLSNRLQLLSGLYIISSIHRIPIICM